jgi:hypothetical protein
MYRCHLMRLKLPRVSNLCLKLLWCQCALLVQCHFLWCPNRGLSNSCQHLKRRIFIFRLRISKHLRWPNSRCHCPSWTSLNQHPSIFHLAFSISPRLTLIWMGLGLIFKANNRLKEMSSNKDRWVYSKTLRTCFPIQQVLGSRTWVKECS